MNVMKIGRNAECPCGSGLKFKHCCMGKVDWPSLTEAPLPVASRHFTIRGKNLQFVTGLLAALQIDYSDRNPDFAGIKRAFTPDAVRKIHSLVLDLWPGIDDYERCIAPERESISALYTGTYEAESVLHAVSRLSLYCDRIYLVDPFMQADRVRDEFNPLLHPAEHRSTTVHYAFLWLSLVPWINAGIVSFVRPMDEFIPGLSHEVFELQRQRIASNSELQQALVHEVEQQMRSVGPLDRGFGEIYILSFPDEALREMFPKLQETAEEGVFKSADEFVAYIQSRRDRHPYHMLIGYRGNTANSTCIQAVHLTNWRNGCAA